MKTSHRAYQEKVRERLLAMGIRQQRIREQAQQEYGTNGSEKARNDLIEAMLLLHGICLLAETMGVSNYRQFEAEISRMKMESHCKS